MMYCHRLNYVIFIYSELVLFSRIVSEKTCALNELFACPDGETCKQLKNSTSLGVCECKIKFKRASPDGACIKEPDSDHSFFPTPDSVYSQGVSESAIAGGLLAAILLILSAAILLFAAKKYRWVQRVRQKAQQFRARHYDTVILNQEDDPPLA